MPGSQQKGAGLRSPGEFGKQTQTPTSPCPVDLGGLKALPEPDPASVVRGEKMELRGVLCMLKICSGRVAPKPRVRRPAAPQAWSQGPGPAEWVPQCLFLRDPTWAKPAPAEAPRAATRLASRGCHGSGGLRLPTWVVFRELGDTVMGPEALSWGWSQHPTFCGKSSQAGLGKQVCPEVCLGEAAAGVVPEGSPASPDASAWGHSEPI